MAWQTLPWFKAFPTCRRHWVRLLVRQEYANCPLTSTRAGLDSGTFLAAPRCQCVWRAPGPGEPGLSQWKFKKGQRRRTRKIPLWAAKGAPESFAPTMLEQSPRCLLVTPQMQRGPLQGKVGRFRSMPYSCKYPSAIYHANQDLVQCFAAAQDFLRLLSNELSNYFGTVGEAAHVTQAFALMQSAFSFEELVLKPPTPQQIDDFWELYSMLLPTLRYTVWPDPATHPEVLRNMDLAKEVVSLQYAKLCDHIRRSYAGIYSHKWRRITGDAVRVRLMTRPRLLVGLLHENAPGLGASIPVIADHIGAFLQPLPSFLVQRMPGRVEQMPFSPLGSHESITSVFHKIPRRLKIELRMELQ